MALPARRAWTVLAGCWLVAAGYNAYLIAPASVLPLVADAFGVDKPAAGLTISAVYVAWLAFQLPGGLVMDRYDNRWLVGGGVTAFAVAAVAAAVAPGYAGLLAARLLGGAAAVFIWTAGANVVGRVFPPKRRALGTSLFVSSAPAGFALGQFAGPPVAAALGWRAVFVAYPAVSLLGVVLFAAAAREPVRNEAALSPRAFARALRRPAVLAVAVSSFCAYSLFLLFNTWMPAYATEVLAVDLGAAGAATALFPLAGLLARPGGGWLADRVGGRRPVIVAAFVLTLPLLGAVRTATDATAFAAVLLAAGFSSQLGIGVYYVFTRELAAEEAAGTSLAVLTTLSVAGSLVTPPAVGWLVETLSWTAAFGYAAALVVAGIGAVLLAPRG